MTQDRVDHLARIPALLEDPASDEGVLLLGRVFLVVEIVEEARHTPKLSVRALLFRVGAHGGLDGERVLPESRPLRMLVKELDRGIAAQDRAIRGLRGSRHRSGAGRKA